MRRGGAGGGASAKVCSFLLVVYAKVTPSTQTTPFSGEATRGAQRGPSHPQIVPKDLPVPHGGRRTPLHWRVSEHFGVPGD